MSASPLRASRACALLAAMAVASFFSGCAAPEPAAEVTPAEEGAASSAVPEETIVYLVRHAEKRSDQGDDPELTAAGAARAEALATRFAEETVDRIYATQYRRTQLTVAPLAERLGQETEVVDAGAVSELVQRILREHRGETVLVCAHSNTLPELLRELGSPEEITIPDERYGDLFVLRIVGESSSLERQRVGD